MISKEDWLKAKSLYKEFTETRYRVAGLAHHMDAGHINDDLMPILESLEEMSIEIFSLENAIESAYIDNVKMTGGKL